MKVCAKFLNCFHVFMYLFIAVAGSSVFKAEQNEFITLPN